MTSLAWRIFPLHSAGASLAMGDSPQRGVNAIFPFKQRS
jgi:hypothetical protein